MSKKIIMTLVLFLIVTPLALSADTVCLKSVLRNGKIKNTTKVVPSGSPCPKRHVAIIDTQSSVNSSGPVGPQGPKGRSRSKRSTGEPGLC